MSNSHDEKDYQEPRDEEMPSLKKDVFSSSVGENPLFESRKLTEQGFTDNFVTPVQKVFEYGVLLNNPSIQSMQVSIQIPSWMREVVPFSFFPFFLFSFFPFSFFLFFFLLFLFVFSNSFNI